MIYRQINFEVLIDRESKIVMQQRANEQDMKAHDKGSPMQGFTADPADATIDKRVTDKQFGMKNMDHQLLEKDTDPVKARAEEKDKNPAKLSKQDKKFIANEASRKL